MKHSIVWIAAVMVVGFAGISWSADPPPADWQAQMDAMRALIEAQNARLEQQGAQLHGQQAEIGRLRAGSNESWLNERRAEQVKTLIRDVLADADTRASLAGDGMTAGWKDNFFLASEDGKFLLVISGQIQFRYVHSNAEDEVSREPAEADEDKHTDGFESRRTKVRFSGHVVDPALTYAIQMNALFQGEEGGEQDIGMGDEDQTGSFILEDAWAAYEFADGWQVKLGQFKGPFLREELVDSKHQLAVERSYVADYFTIDYTQGIQISYDGEAAGVPFRAALMMHDGTYQANTAHSGDVTDFAVAGRGEILLAGDWEQFDDFTTWSGDEMGLMIGMALDYENGATGVSTEEATLGAGATPSINYPKVLKWTVDGSLEVPDMNGLNVFAAVIGLHATDHGAVDPTEGQHDQIAFVVQAGIFIIPDEWDVFARWEYVDFDNWAMTVEGSDGGEFDNFQYRGDQDDTLSIVTVGTNYYFARHAAKATIDFMYAMDPVPVDNTGVGLAETLLDSPGSNEPEDGDQWAIRAQFQLLF